MAHCFCKGWQTTQPEAYLVFNCWSFPDLMRMNLQHSKPAGVKNGLCPTTSTMQTTAGIGRLLITGQSSPPSAFQRNQTLPQKEGWWGFDYLHWVTIQTQRHHSLTGSGRLWLSLLTPTGQNGELCFTRHPELRLQVHWCMSNQSNQINYSLLVRYRNILTWTLKQ